MTDGRPDNWLASVDHGLFTQHHATGRNLVIQCMWLYEHPIDLDGVKRFQQYLGRGLLGRRIERSPLPFARHRWILDRGPTDLQFDESARPRAELTDWADQHAQVPIDPESGPGWHLAGLRLTDGSTVFSLVLSHYLVDGLGLVMTLIDAGLGNARNLGYPPPRARPRVRALAQDVRRTARDAPEVFRALRVAAKRGREQRRAIAETTAPQPSPTSVPDRDESVVVPGVTVAIDASDWDSRANALGGTASTLGAAFAAKLGELAGRCRASDGAVTVELPMNARVEGDTRANAMSFARVSLDPTLVTTDLSAARSAIKDALKALQDNPDDSIQMAWLAAYTPKRAFRRMDEGLVADPDHPIFYSNLGDVGAVVSWLDGTPAEFVTARVLAQRESRRWLERTGGQMILQSLRVPGSFVISVNAYQPGAPNTKAALRDLVGRALRDFDLTGTFDLTGDAS